MSETVKPDDFARQTQDGHLFLSDEMALKYGIDARKYGWRRDADLSGWRSPYINPWTVIHAHCSRTFPAAVATP